MARAIRKADAELDLEKLRYQRAANQYIVTKSREAATRELEQYYVFAGKILGIDITLAEVEAKRMQDLMVRYEWLTGYKLGSPELEAAVDRTIAAM